MPGTARGAGFNGLEGWVQPSGSAKVPTTPCPVQHTIIRVPTAQHAGHALELALPAGRSQCSLGPASHLDVVELHHQFRIVLLRHGPRLRESRGQGLRLIEWRITPSPRAIGAGRPAPHCPCPVPRAGSRHPVRQDPLGLAQLSRARTRAGMTPAMLMELGGFGRRHLCCQLERVAAGRALAGAPASREHTRTQEWTNAGVLHRDCRILMQGACSALVGWACRLADCMQGGGGEVAGRGRGRCSARARQGARRTEPCSFRGPAQLRDPALSSAALQTSWQRKPRRKYVSKPLTLVLYARHAGVRRDSRDEGRCPRQVGEGCASAAPASRHGAARITSRRMHARMHACTGIPECVCF